MSNSHEKSDAVFDRLEGCILYTQDQLDGIVEAAVDKERQRCARIAEDNKGELIWPQGCPEEFYAVSEVIAKAIRNTK